MWLKFRMALIYIFSLFLGIFPFRIQYVFSDIMFFLAFHVLRYRRKVVVDNLTKCFPEKSQDEIKKIERDFYKSFCDILLETLLIITFSRKSIDKRMVYENRDEFEERTKGISCICATGHYGNWEYTSSYGGISNHKLLGVYHPLKNKVFDEFYLRTRSKFGSFPIPMKNIVREIVRRHKQGQTLMVALIADQTPPRYEANNLFTFLGRLTPFFMGTEKLALKFKMPVYFGGMRKHKRGHYSFYFEEIYDGKEDVQEYEITRRYAAKLESLIKEDPALWLWSHRRWKFVKEDAL